MREEELKEALERITMSYEVKEELINKLNLQKNKRKYLSRFLAFKKVKIAVFLILVTGLIAFPVKAVVLSLVRERMEQVPQQEMDEIAEAVNQSDANADIFSRDFMESEINRLNELYKEYQNGRFPEGSITEIVSEIEINPESICFLPSTQTYYFPLREMSDEELLQYIDFHFKRSYALEQNLDEEIMAEQEESEKEQNEKIQDIKNLGGISLEEANQIGGEWLQKLFQTDKEGMENNCYLYDTSDVDTAVTNKHPNIYMSYYGTLYEHYYFYIDADSGNLVSAELSDASVEEEDVALNLVQDNMQINLESAKSVLWNILGNEQEFLHIYCGYGVTEDNQIDSGIVSFHFVKEDNTDYKVQINADTQELVSFSDVYYESEEETRQRLEELKEFLKKTKGEYEEITYYRLEVE